MSSNRTRLWTFTPRGEFSCGECSSALVQPLEWERLGGDEWRVLLRCPECFGVGVIHMTPEQVGLFRNSLDEATQHMEETAEYLDHEVFRESCDRFALALRAGHICPMDF
jgi:hypothetical protein